MYKKSVFINNRISTICNLRQLDIANEVTPFVLQRLTHPAQDKYTLQYFPAAERLFEACFFCVQVHHVIRFRIVFVLGRNSTFHLRCAEPLSAFGVCLPPLTISITSSCERRDEDDDDDCCVVSRCNCFSHTVERKKEKNTTAVGE